MKKCVFRCSSPLSLFGLPKNEELWRLWLEFIYIVIPEQLNLANVFLCGNHFTDICFTNRGQFELGYAKKLILIDTAVPTLRSNAASHVMPLSGAEKQRLYRARRDADPARRAKYLDWVKKKWKRDREQGKRKSIKEFTESEQTRKRKQWREAQAKRRAAKKAASDACSNSFTPPPNGFTGTSEEEPTTSSPWRFTDSHCQTTNLKFSSAAIQSPKVSRMVSVGTQLSWGTLREFRLRSKGTQTPNNISAEIEMSSNYRLSSTSGQYVIPRKQPHWETMEEWAPIDDDDNISLPPKDEDPSSELPNNPLESRFSVPKSPVSTEDIELLFEEKPAFSNTKYIVYESCLRQLLNSCPVCSMPCDVKGHRMGTFVTFDQHCPHCNYSRDWKSQPIIGSTPLGNLQMSAAIYFTGLSFFQVQKLCNALQLQLFQYDTYRKHARNYLEPAIVHKWRIDQQQILNQLQQGGGKIKVGGDMWTDSPGDAAEYGSYTLTHLESNTIVDLQLVQSNEVERCHMEKEGLKRCLDYLCSNSLAVDYIVTDCCPKIQEFLKEQNITQFYDTRLFEKGLSKRLEKVSHDKDSTVVKKWLHAIKNHLYWSATSSTSGPEMVAKWTSLINHMQNVHKHGNPLYPKCTHPDVISSDTQKWLQPGSHVLNQVEKILNDKQVLEDVAKLSHNLQTYSQEAFHSLIQNFTPKNVVFPFTGMLCRLYLAAMHHNENAYLSQISTEGLAPIGESCCESKKGVKREPTYNYLDELMGLVFEVLQDPAPFLEEMKKIILPQNSV